MNFEKWKESDIDNVLNSIKANTLDNVKDEDIINSFKNIQAALENGKDNLAMLQAEETGKPIKYCYAEIQRCNRIIDNAIACLIAMSVDSGLYVSNEVTTKWYRKKLPIGLVLGFTPFSSPYSSFIHKLAASLIYRNNFICKPSPKAINCSYKLFSVIKANCDEQVKNSFYILPLYNDSLARYLLKKGGFDCLLFTGKSSTAYEIKNVIGRKRAVFETGSSAAVYVGKTADIELAAQNIVKGAFSQTGMRCVAAKNVFINEDIFDAFSFVFMEQVKKIKFGSQFDISTDVGPILDKEILEGLVSYINDLKINGYRVIRGGNIVGGNILEQTALLNEGSAYYSVQEAYGPVLCLHKVQDMYSIPEIYYKRSSLNISIFSNNHKEIQEWISNCRCSGSIFINHGPTQRIDMLPFGGMCDENEGKEGMLELIHVLTKDQVVFDCI